ncbi:type III-B CRISPR module RAMP protein Cmr4 [Moraxella cuniculi]|uniref:CRISPR type III-B/RAMP module RAMP protein Cmr4 n=1 Tax=Moraxella cuniculi TaxID=34061 RepID=A0A448GTY8_9GAMM|nr:type III-B CRISPR module RAMP protein Cmr4 [Moraxella cuniculi]VEG12222.1 CRISPR type III-B/RAMP module RAMP protein Cmr4 [Moraxella cuniculi]
MQTRIFHLQNLTALHVGTGQGVGVVDLPIARSKATNLPIVPGSAIKGVLRDELKSQGITTDDVNVLFGKDKDADHAGAIAFGDANLLILPIRSFAGTVAYATCSYILRQYGRDINENLTLSTTKNEACAYVVEDSVLLLGNKIALEDLDINAKSTQEAKDIADKIAQALYPDSTPNANEWRKEFAQRFVILPDDIFSFLADTATEIRTRIRIVRETRMAQQGALWTEENLPADAVLWGVLGISKARDKSERSEEELANLLPKDEINIQIGGKHTVGRGFCRLLINKNNNQ